MLGRMFPCMGATTRMQDPEFVHKAFGDIAGRYVVTNHVLSLGIDVLWRRRVAREVAKLAPDEVLDLATGTGDLAMAIEKRCPDAVVTGADFCEPMLEVARKRGLENLVVADGMAMPFEDGAFDVVTVAFGLRNMADWAGAVREMARVIRPGGTLMVLDFSLPKGGLRRRFYRTYLHGVLPKIAGLITRKRDAYEYLAGSIEKFPSGEAMCEMLVENGFDEASAKELTGGVASLYTATRKS